MGQIAIIAPAITQWVAEMREMLAELRSAETRFTSLSKAIDEAQQAHRSMMFNVGEKLNAVRARMPKRDNTGNGWTAFLEAVELDQAVAWKYMKYAERVPPYLVTQQGKQDAATGRFPSLADVELTKTTGPEQPDTTPPKDEDAPAEMLDHGPTADRDDKPDNTEKKANRDAWCTPGPIARALPKKLDLDPCSNEHSIVKAKTKYMLHRGEDGLVLPWFGLTFVNGPYSKLGPWAEKLDREREQIKGCGFLVNADNSPEWWHVLKKHLTLRLDFDKRQEFIPPPGVEPSKNDRPQTLLMDEAFWAACDQRALLSMGTLWKQVTAA